ncbi:hypothetical protein D3C80_1669940 [compost metagenome]
MAVQGPHTAAMVDNDAVSVTAPPFGNQHCPGISSVDAGALRNSKVYAGMHFADLTRYRMRPLPIARGDSGRTYRHEERTVAACIFRGGAHAADTAGGPRFRFGRCGRRSAGRFCFCCCCLACRFLRLQLVLLRFECGTLAGQLHQLGFLLLGDFA